jgi:hypothetical protein
MPADSLAPLVNLAADHNIAIRTLTTMLYICVGAIVGLGGFILYLMKTCREDARYAWDSNKEMAAALKAAGTDLAVIKEFARKAAGS